MKENFLYLVINFGFHSVRGIVFASNGEIISRVSRPLHTLMVGEGVEQDTQEWLDQLDSVMNEIVADVSVRNRIKYMTITSSASCLVVTDIDYKAIGKAMMVADKRPQEEASVLRSIPEAVCAAKSQQLRLDLTQMIPKIMWWRKQNSHIVDISKCRYMSPNDFLTLHFTDEFVTDELNAEKMLFCSKVNQYPTDLLHILDIYMDQLPRVVPAGTMIGRVKDSLTKKYGLSKEVFFIVTTYDAICGFWGAGPGDIGDACDVSGTVTSLRVLADSELKLNSTDGLFCQTAGESNLFIIGGSNNLGGGLIEWIKQLLYEDSEHVYSTIENDAQKSSVGARGIIFLPYLMGERAPIWDSHARGVFFGLERFHGKVDMTRAVFEAIGFSLLSLVESVEKSGTKINKIKVSGGLGRIKLINQIKADITGKEIHVVDELETSSLGAFLYMGKAVGLFSNLRSAAVHFSQVREVIYPNPRVRNQYHKIYELYQSLYEALKWQFLKRSELFEEFYSGKISDEDQL